MDESKPRFSQTIEDRVRTREAARLLRRSATKGEQMLWEQLRGRRFMGNKFRRQQPIGPFIADFYCSEHQLVIEIDGSSHNGREGEDAERQQLMESTGVRFLRVTETEVTTNMTTVLKKIAEALERTPSP